MTEVSFYHLTRSTLFQALPQLLQRTLAAGQRALVVAGTREALSTLSEALWAHPGWLPHGTPEEGDADLQPIWLDTTPSPVNGARYLFLTDGAAGAEGFERVFDLFDGSSPAAVEAARDRWRAARAAGYQPNYWRQTETGWHKNK
jgi:DNA polymerase-3 subunit chi